MYFLQKRNTTIDDNCPPQNGEPLPQSFTDKEAYQVAENVKKKVVQDLFTKTFSTCQKDSIRIIRLIDTVRKTLENTPPDGLFNSKGDQIPLKEFNVPMMIWLLDTASAVAAQSSANLAVVSYRTVASIVQGHPTPASIKPAPRRDSVFDDTFQEALKEKTDAAKRTAKITAKPSKDKASSKSEKSKKRKKASTTSKSKKKKVSRQTLLTLPCYTRSLTSHSRCCAVENE
jgi:hypothetical protein